MTAPHDARATTVALDNAAIRLIKRIALVFFGPFYFLFVAFVPLLCAKRPGFRGWYWRTVKRGCSRLLWLLSIEVVISDEDKRRLGDDTNSIMVLNHRSHLDGFTLMDVVPDKKWFTFAAKKELCDAALLRTGFSGAGLIEIDRNRGKHAMGALSAAIKDMPERRSVMLFPEGSRAKSETLDPFKAGAVVAARETGRTIRPIVIRGSDTLLSRGRFVPKSGQIKIDVLDSFVCDPDATVDEDVARLRDAMLQVFHNT